MFSLSLPMLRQWRRAPLKVEARAEVLLKMSKISHIENVDIKI